MSFVITLQAVRSLWQVLRLGSDILTNDQIAVLVERTLREIAQQAIPKRRARNCKRAVRQPVSSWPRLTTNAYEKGDFVYEVIPVNAV